MQLLLQTVLTLFQLIELFVLCSGFCKTSVLGVKKCLKDIVCPSRSSQLDPISAVQNVIHNRPFENFILAQFCSNEAIFFCSVMSFHTKLIENQFTFCNSDVDISPPYYL